MPDPVRRRDDRTMSPIGTFETCRLTPEMSAFRGISEVPFRDRQDRV
jgi:hypothetical protein